MKYRVSWKNKIKYRVSQSQSPYQVLPYIEQGDTCRNNQPLNWWVGISISSDIFTSNLQFYRIQWYILYIIYHCLVSYCYMIILPMCPPPIMYWPTWPPHPTGSLLYLCWHQPLHLHWHLSAHLAPTVLLGILPTHWGPGSPSLHLVTHPCYSFLTPLVSCMPVS